MAGDVGRNAHYSSKHRVWPRFDQREHVRPKGPNGRAENGRTSVCFNAGRLKFVRTVRHGFCSLTGQ